MQTSSLVQANRAIASLLLRRSVTIPSKIITAIVTALWVSSIWLAIHTSAWWLLATLGLVPWIILGLIVIGVSSFVAKQLLPRTLSAAEKRQIATFIDSSSSTYATATGTSLNPLFLGLLVVWRYLRSRGKRSMSTIIMEPVDQAKQQKQEFLNIVKLFS